MSNISKPFVLQTDNSSVALEAVIYQKQDDAVASRTKTDQEQTFSIYELVSSSFFALVKFKPFSKHKEFLLENDNSLFGQ